MTGPEYLDRKLRRQGPIRHESLPPEMIEQIKAVYDVIGPYLNMTLEQFEIKFMRDVHPEIEVSLWRTITVAWLRYHETFLDGQTLRQEKEKQRLAALISISAGVNDPEKLEVPVEVGLKLLQCYIESSKE